MWDSYSHNADHSKLALPYESEQGKYRTSFMPCFIEQVSYRMVSAGILDLNTRLQSNTF